jgi:hypothetical protein
MKNKCVTTKCSECGHIYKKKTPENIDKVYWSMDGIMDAINYLLERDRLMRKDEISVSEFM